MRGGMRMGQTRIALLLALGASLTAATTAETLAEAPKPKGEAGATVTVTAEANPVELAKTPNPVTVVTTEKLEQLGKDNLSDLLQTLFPGQVTRTGGIGTTSSFMLGGARPKDVAVTIDGIRINDASGLVGVNASLVNLAGIDRAEIQQGPCSSRFGSDAMGGVIALYSAGAAPQGLSGEARLKAGTGGILGTTVAPSYGWGSGWIRGGVDLQREDSATATTNPYRSTGSFLGFGQEIANNTLVTLTYRNAYTGVPLPIVSSTYGSAPRSSSSYDESREGQSRNELMSGTIRTVFSTALRGELTLGHFTLERTEPSMYPGYPNDKFTARSNQLSGSLTYDWSKFASISAGLDASDTHALTPDYAGGSYDSKDLRVAPYLEAQVEPLANLRFVGSLRWDYDRQDVPTPALERVKNSTTQYTGKFGINYILPLGFRVFASTGTGFSTPLLYNSMYNVSYSGEALQNEKSKFIQAGASYEHGPWKAKLELSRTIFSSLVYFDSNGGVLYHSPYGDYYSGIYRNGNGIRIQSAQVSGGYETKHCGLTGFYRNQEARDSSLPESQQLTSNAVIRRPFQTLGLSTYCVLGEVRLDARWSWSGSRYDYAGYQVPAFAYRAHYNDLSASAIWAVRKNVTITLRGDHLMQPKTTKGEWLARTRDLDNDTSQVYGYPSQPPSGSLEVRYRF